MPFLYVFYSDNVLYTFRTDKLFIFRRRFLLYVQILVCVMLNDIKIRNIILNFHKLNHCVVRKVIYKCVYSKRFELKETQKKQYVRILLIHMLFWYELFMMVVRLDV